MTLPKLLVPGLLLAALTTAGCTKSNPVTPTTTTCTFAVGQPSLSTFPSEGGTGTAAVTAASTCSWTAASNASFVTIAQGASGTGNGTVQFTVGASSATADRTGTMTIAGSTVTITQRAATTPPTPVTLSAPAAMSPTGGQTVDASRPTLVVSNSTATGAAGAVTYRFEVSDLNSFPDDPARTVTVDGVAQGSAGSTSWTLTRDLSPNVLWFWRARATNGTVTSAFSNVETFRTASTCSYALSATNLTIAANGGTSTVTVTTTSGCAWSATSNAAFISVASGSGGTGNGSVTLSIASNATGISRTGTVTIAGQTVTVTQQGTNLSAGFRLIDPGRQPGAVTECQIRSLTSVATQCILESTSFPLGANTITSYTWAVSYTYPSEKNFTQAGTNSRFSFTELCGQTGSNDGGAQIELRVTLTVTDSEGNSVTVRSNAGSQPLLTLRAYVCGI